MLEPKSTGQTIKEIRKNKKIRQNTFPGVSKSTLANIESEERMPSVQKYNQILSRLDITIHEFEYIRHNFGLSRRQQLIKSFIEHKHSLYAERTQSLAQDMDTYLETNPDDQVIKDYRTVLDVYKKINESQTYEINSPGTAEIWDRIEDQKIWYYYDIDLMARIFYVFPLSTSEKMIQKIVEQIEKYNDFTNTMDLKQAFLLNSAKYLIHHEKYKEAKPLILQAKKLTEEQESVYLSLYASASLAAIQLTEKKLSLEQGELEIDRICNLFIALDRKIFADDVRRDWNEFLKTYFASDKS
ncbi:helix-turn-helix domain-containing protein [Listeria booriae]|uniref:HTH cro/C1-type domain-containing protein n=1 Tax=Listeria booriae TaxID=1552123 RepID=A0A7X0ZWU6_9LIST|nr:helix-turn-helix transcriptional regulator [Listeria booriae]MBC1780500.1 hypothetical protein [Listeria booriae]MBC2305872.1 hypothetical protein [Listeria booriae]MBC2312023.1 hypothetical protein [Listeria booriae]MCD2208619.1 helix-turn-helix domain-containing protein [Listeria booriae]MDT0112441.1 helix-turn-helix transcriptional regulator [Listeria booriae]